MFPKQGKKLIYFTSIFLNRVARTANLVDMAPDKCHILLLFTAIFVIARIGADTSSRGKEVRNPISQQQQNETEVSSKGKDFLNHTEDKSATSQPTLTARERNYFKTFGKPFQSNNSINCSTMLRVDNITQNCSQKITAKKSLLPESSSSTDNVSAFDIMLYGAFSLIFIIGTVGNSMVCYVFGWKRRKIRPPPETLFFYLGIVDLIASIINPLLYIYWKFTKYKRWDFGYIGCKILVPLNPISVTMSALLILIIAIDRCMIIVNPMGRRYRNTAVNFTVLIALLIAILSYLHYIIALKVDNACLVKNTSDLAYAIPTAVVFLLQDITIITVLFCTNVIIKRKLNDSEILEMLEKLKANRKVEHQKLVRILMAVGILFCLLTIPRDIFHLAYSISWLTPGDGIPYNYLIRTLNEVLKVLHSSNSCVNVFLYSKMHNRFHKHISQLICGKFSDKTDSTLRATKNSFPIPKSRTSRTHVSMLSTSQKSKKLLHAQHSEPNREDIDDTPV